MKRIIFGLLIVLWGFCSAQADETKNIYRLMIFGDSLSAGYRLNKNESFAAQLQQALIDAGYNNVKVINNSRSGETTAGGLRRQPKAINLKPNGVLLELGINDILHGDSISETTKNLSTLIQNFQSNHIAVLLAGMKAPPITEPVYAQQFEQMYRTLAQKFHVQLYPFFMQALFETAGGRYDKALPYLLPDKAHPTSEGVSLIVKNILPTVISFLEQQKITPTHTK